MSTRYVRSPRRSAIACSSACALSATRLASCRPRSVGWRGRRRASPESRPAVQSPLATRISVMRWAFIGSVPSLRARWRTPHPGWSVTSRRTAAWGAVRPRSPSLASHRRRRARCARPRRNPTPPKPSSSWSRGSTPEQAAPAAAAVNGRVPEGLRAWWPRQRPPCRVPSRIRHDPRRCRGRPGAPSSRGSGPRPRWAARRGVVRR